MKDNPTRKTPRIPKFRPIVFDLDDVLCEFNASLAQVLAEHLDDPSVATHHHTWSQYEIAHLYPSVDPFDDIFHHMERHGIIDTLSVVSSARNLCNAFYEMGHEIVILTARGWMTNPEVITKRWLDTNGVKYDRLIISGHKMSKKYYMPSEALCYFDDNAQHILDCAHLVDRPYLVSRPWNTSLTTALSNVMRIDISTLDLYADSINQLSYVLNHAHNPDAIIETSLPNIRRCDG